ncbi:hypothetical protein ADUPG1_007305, partial [Aduncisulcus paluster]
GDNVEVLFGDVVDPTGTVSQDTTSPCGSDSSSSSSSSSCSYLEDHRVCGVDYSVDNGDDTELACICGSGYYEDVSSGECVLASSSSSSACSNCGGDRGTCVYDSDSGDESLPFCECSDGWYGTDCSSICPVSDDLGLCSGSSHGTCDAATHTCVCESGYYGSSCNLYCDSLSRCGLHGRCAVDDLSSETLYCKCDAGWYGSTCFTQYPVETIEYVNEDDETNPTIVDYVCGVNYSTDPSSSYSDYGIYSSDTDTSSCDCSSYGLITDASTSTCIDPATHPYYKDIAGNDTACLTCGTTTDSHGTCVLGEGEDSLIAMCQCEYGWGNDVDDSSEPSSSCSIDMCGVSEDTYTESNANPSSLCSSHGVCYSYDSSDSNNASSIQYACTCDDGWNGIMCGEEDSNAITIVVWIFIVVSAVSIIVGVIGLFLWLRLKRSNNNTSTIDDSDLKPEMASREDLKTDSMTPVIQVRGLHESESVVHESESVVQASPRLYSESQPTLTVKRRVKKKRKDKKPRWAEEEEEDDGTDRQISDDKLEGLTLTSPSSTPITSLKIVREDADVVDLPNEKCLVAPTSPRKRKKEVSDKIKKRKRRVKKETTQTISESTHKSEHKVKKKKKKHKTRHVLQPIDQEK